MMRLLGSVALLTLVFILPVFVIRAQPLAAGPLDWLFMSSEDCAAPCFLGVRPHESNITEAVNRLRSHPAVSKVNVNIHNGRSFIAWDWQTGATENHAFMFTGLEDRVEWLVLPQRVTLGELRLVLGDPQRITATTNGSYAPRVAFVLEYPARSLHIFAEFHVCAIDQNTFWQMRPDGNSQASFFLGLGHPDYIRVMPNRPVDLDPSAWANQLRALCGR